EAHSSLKLEPFNGGGEHELMVTASALGESGELGTVLFLEDVSQLAKAERLRRQLAAGADGEAGKLLEECTRTIISEVEDLKRLVAEFSAFARMPHLNPVPGHLNPLVEETAATFRETNPGVEFAVELAPTLPRIAIDREALKRALVNL